MNVDKYELDQSNSLQAFASIFAMHILQLES